MEKSCFFSIAYLPKVEFPHPFVQTLFHIFTPDVLRLPFSSVSARKGTSMSWAPRPSRQFDFGYCSQESEATASSQSRSAYGDQTAHGSNVFMDQQSFLRYQETDTQVGNGTGNLLPPLGRFPQAPILTGVHPYPPCCLTCMLCCVFFDAFFSSTHLFNLSCSILRCVWWTVLHCSA